MTMTMREKDDAVVGELARRLEDPRAQLLFSRSTLPVEAARRRRARSAVPPRGDAARVRGEALNRLAGGAHMRDE
jgi:hypothetical protein